MIRSLEEGAWTAGGADVFVQGQLRSYARLLGVELPAALAERVPSAETAPRLVSYSHMPRYRRLAEQAGRRAVYMVLTVALVAPIWLYTRPHIDGTLAPAQSLDELPATAERVSAPASRAAARVPLVASIASLPEPPPVAAPAQVTFQFNGDSWVEILSAGTDARVLERATVKAGQSRSFDANAVGRVLLGNSAAVEVKRAGELVDLTPFSRANVARFTLSSDGSLAPVLD